MTTPPKDIIGIVKELQEWNDVRDPIDGNEYAEFIRELEKAFPSIAQALLISMESLDEISNLSISMSAVECADIRENTLHSPCRNADMPQRREDGQGRGDG